MSALGAPVAAAIVASALIHVTWNVAAKRAQGHFGVMWLGQAIAAVGLLPFGAWFAVQNPVPLTGAAYGAIAVCGLLQALYFMLLAKAYQVGEISMVYPIARGSGVALTAVAARIFLGDAVSPLGALGIAAIGVGGITIGLDARPRVGGIADTAAPAAVALPGLGYAILIALTLAAGSINDKIAVGMVPPVTYSAAMFAVAALGSLPLVLARHRPALRDAWTRHFRTSAVVGLGSMGGYLIILFLLRTGPLSYIVAFRELSVVLGAIAGVVVFKERPTRRRFLGVAIIAGGLVLVKLA